MKTYIDKTRNLNSNGSQSEKPSININNNDIIINGYQKFTINKTNIIYEKDKYNILKNILIDLKSSCNSITDIGCSNGLLSFISNNLGYNVLSLDHDSECIEIINKIINHLQIEKLICKQYSFGDSIDNKNDIVLMMAIIHWIYSCTSLYGNFDSIFQYIYPYIGKYLLIEWVDNDDIHIQNFNHIKYNSYIHTEQYNKQNFEKSLKKNIGNIINTHIIDRSTRILYIVEKV
jgi:hypothetical protein